MKRAFVALWLFACVAYAAGRDESVDELWQAEGRALGRLVDVSQGAERADALLRLGLWGRQAATRLLAGSGDAARVEELLDRADGALADSLADLPVEHLPTALFALGDLRRARANEAGAREPLERLVENFPDHALALDASLALGDDAFEAGRLAQATERYRFVIERAPSNGDGAVWARYKLAWCRINTGEQAEARRLLFTVADRGDGRALVDEARRDFVLALARDVEIGPDAALAELSQLVEDEDRWRRYAKAWADLVAEAGRDEEAAETYARLIPRARIVDAGRMLASSLEIAVRRRDRQAVLSLGQTLADVAELQALAKDVKMQAERALRVAAVTLHGEARANADRQGLEDAATLYADYLRAFPDDPHAYELHHHAGELLLTLGLPALAERHYTAAVIEDMRRHAAGEPRGKWLAPSARGAVVAAEALLPSVDAAGASVEGPVELSAIDDRYLRACERYLDTLPDGESVADVALGHALLLYRRHHFERALAGLEPLALGDAHGDVASQAALAALDALRALGRWESLARFAEALGRRPNVAQTLGTQLADVREAALLAAAEEQAKKGEHADAARRYLRVAAEYPKGTRVHIALYNAASSFAVDGELVRATDVRERLIATLDKGPLRDKALAQQLDNLVRIGRFEQAGEVALLWSQDLSGQMRAEKLSDAIVLLEAAGADKRANELRERYLKSGAGPDALVHALALARSLRGCIPRMTAFRRAVRVAKSTAERVRALEATAREEERCEEGWWAEKHANEALTLGKSLSTQDADALDALGEAGLVVARRALRKASAHALRPPFERSIPKRFAALEAAEAELASVVARGRAVPAVCALVASGEGWAELAQALADVQAPRTFTEEQRDLFEQELRARAQPLAERAAQTLIEARAKAREAGVAPACLDATVTALERLRPEEFARRLERLPVFYKRSEPDTERPEDVLERAPDAPAAWLIAARRELARKRPRAALLLLERIAPDDALAQAVNALRHEAFVALGDGTRAQAIAHDARVRTQAPWAYAREADAAVRQRDYRALLDALDHLEKLHPAHSLDASWVVARGVAARALGDTEKALALYRHALELDESSPDAHLALGLLLCTDANAQAQGLEHLRRFRSLRAEPPDAQALENVERACEALIQGGDGG